MSKQITAVLTSRGLVIPVDDLVQLYTGQGKATGVYNRLTLRYQPRIGRAVTVKLYQEAARNIQTTQQAIVYLPRGLIGELISRGVIIKCTLAPINRVQVPTFGCELFPNQQIIVERLVQEFTPERIAAGTATALLNLRAGMGKTFIAAAIISYIALPTLYVVPTDYLADQAVKDLRGCFDEKSIVRWDRSRQKKRRANTDHSETESESSPLVTVIVINSALLESAEFFRRFGFSVYDEVHTFCADKRREIFERITWATLGMSATTEQRKDTFDRVSHWHLTGSTSNPWVPSIIRADSLPGFTMDDVNFICNVKVIKYKGPAEYTQTLKHPSTDKMFTPWMHKQFLRDERRTSVMLADLNRLYDWVGPQGQVHRIFVFCEEKEPLADLYKILGSEFDVDAPELHEQVGTFIGGTKPAEVARVKHSARVILTTYGYSSTGISIVDMTAIIFWTPRRSNMLQIIPRIMRRGGDLSIPREIVDIVDWSTPMKSQYYERRNAYDYFSANLTETTVDTRQKKPALTT